MKGLGSFPETVLLRHPFYDAVYKAEQTRLWRLAADQGMDMTSATVKARINKSAHQGALKGTRATMYTIERLSNAAVLLRWTAPFFPAFENALKTWGRIAYTKPQVLGYGALAWNAPNNMGLVYDENGNQVERSNMFKDDKTFIVMPQGMSDFLAEKFPDYVSPGVPVKWRQQGANVVFPGNEWWWPGVGPMMTTTTALALRGKPDTVDILRANMSENIFNGVVPMGNPNVDIKDLWLSTTAKRVDQGFTGTSENGAYLSLMNTIVEDVYIDAQIAGRAVTKADMKRAYDTTQKFWKWAIRAAAMDFTPSSYNSPYTAQRAYWVELMDDQSMSYDDKLAAFKSKYPDMMAVTRSGTESITGLQPNLSTWNKITKNPELVRELNNIDPELVGMFGNMGSFDDPFSYSVYGEFANMTIGKDGKPIKDQLSPEQILKNNEVTDGWIAQREVKAMLEDKAIAAGYSSIQADSPFRDLLKEAESEIADRYPLWGIEKTTYVDKLPKFIAGARILVNNTTVIGEDKTMALLSDYLEMRDFIAAEKAKAGDDDTKAALVAVGYEAAAELRAKDIGFADLYDRYLASDDFREFA